MDQGLRGLRSLVRDVDWSLSYVGFLLYIFVIVTFRFSLGDIAMAVALGGLFFEKRGFKFPTALGIFGLFLVWGLIGYVNAPYPDVTFDRLDAFLRLWLIFLVAVNVLNSGPRIRFFLLFLLVIFATHPVRGALFNTFVYGYSVGDRVVWRGAFGNPNDLAALTLLPLALAAALLRDRHQWIRWGALASVVVLPTLILLTQSRGGILALGIFGIFTLLAERRRLRTLALVGLVGLGVAFVAPTGAWERMEDLVTAQAEGNMGAADDQGSAEQRLTIWKVATEIIRENPVTGVGLGAYRYAHADRALANPEYALASGTRDVHSTYLGVLAETGWPGFLTFLMLLFAVIRDSVRTRRRYAGPASDQLRYLEIALYAYLVAGLFGTFFHLAFLYLHLACIVVMAAQIRRQARRAYREGPTPKPGAGRRRTRRPVPRVRAEAR